MTGDTIDAADLYRSPDAAREVARRYDALLSAWPVPCSRHRLGTRHGETFVLECGNRDKPPVLLIHGAIANSSTWIGDAAILAPHLHLFAVDVIGEPGFSAPGRPALDSAAHAEWLEDVLDALSVPTVAVVGISLGGWLGLDFAIRRAGRVSALAVIAPGGVGAQRNVLVWALPLSLLGQWGRDKVRERLLGPPPAPEEMTPTLQQLIALHALITRSFRPRYDKLPIFDDARLSALRLPVMAVVAGRDVMLAPQPMKQRLEALVPDLEMHYLPQARHFPGSQAERVLDFLRRRASAAHQGDGARVGSQS